MHYVIQENVFREPNYNKIFDTLTKLDLSFEVVNCKSGDEEIVFETDRKDIFVFGSVRLAKLSTKYGWIPGSFFGNNHDYSIYSEFYKENLLNYGCKIQPLSEPIEWDYNELKFIRPCKDSKAFNGQVFTKIKWEDLMERESNNPNSISSPDMLIQVSNLKTIYKEARVWIVDGKVITSSYYKFGSNVEWNENVDPEGLEFAQNMVDLYEVAEAFVMDICLTPDGWKIVEINCINCSGFYEGDLQKIVIALEDKYNPIVVDENTEMEGEEEFSILGLIDDIFHFPLIPLHFIMIVYVTFGILKERDAAEIALMDEEELEETVDNILKVKMDKALPYFYVVGVIEWYYIIKFIFF